MKMHCCLPPCSPCDWLQLGPTPENGWTGFSSTELSLFYCSSFVLYFVAPYNIRNETEPQSLDNPVWARTRTVVMKSVFQHEESKGGKQKIKEKKEAQTTGGCRQSVLQRHIQAWLVKNECCEHAQCITGSPPTAWTLSSTNKDAMLHFTSCKMSQECSWCVKIHFNKLCLIATLTIWTRSPSVLVWC